MMVVLRDFVANAKPCGSGLAHEEGGAGYVHFRQALKNPEALAIRVFCIAEQSAVKPLHQRILRISRLRQLFTQQRRVMRLFRGLVRQFRDVADVAADFFSHGTLLFGRGGDLVVMSVMLATASLMPTRA